MADKDVKRRSKRDTVSRSEFYQLTGLLVLAEGHEKALREIEKAALAITQEIDPTTGEVYEVWGGGHTGDSVYGAAKSAGELLNVLGVEIDDDRHGT